MGLVPRLRYYTGAGEGRGQVRPVLGAVRAPTVGGGASESPLLASLSSFQSSFPPLRVDAGAPWPRPVWNLGHVPHPFLPRGMKAKPHGCVIAPALPDGSLLCYGPWGPVAGRPCVSGGGLVGQAALSRRGG